MNETLKTLKERRSCRVYKPDPIPAAGNHHSPQGFIDSAGMV